MTDNKKLITSYNWVMPVIEPVIRPPAEAFSFLLQITTGCSANTCSFCGAYQGKPFHIKPYAEIATDIQTGMRRFPNTRKVFLMDGDALVLNNTKLIPILETIQSAFPRLTRISSYANGHNLSDRSSDELQELARNKLTLVYIGLESGSQRVLDFCQKKSSVEQIIQGVQKAQSAGLKCSVIVLLGLGGARLSAQHCEETIAAINAMQPRLLSFLSVIAVPGTKLWQAIQENKFRPLSAVQLLNEAHSILKGLNLQGTVFRCNHASNYLPLEGRLPLDKKRLLEEIEAGLADSSRLKPEWLRAL